LVLACGERGQAAEEPSVEHQRLREKARALNQQGEKLYQDGHHDRAAQLFQEAVAILEKAYPREQFSQGHADLAEGLNNLGVTLDLMGQHRRALSYHERALAMRQALYPKEKYPQGHPHLAQSLNSLGLLLKSMGQYDRALPYQEQALAMREGLYLKDQFPRGHAELANSLNNLGLLLWSMGQYGKALPYFERALAMREGLYPKDQFPQGHAHLAQSLHNLGGLLWSKGETGQALTYFERSLAMYEGLYPRDKYPQGHLSLAQSLNNLGLTLRSMGQYGRALPYVERALAMHQGLYPKDKYPQGHPELARSLGNLGLLLASMGRYGQALPYYERALAMYQGLYPKDKYPQGHPELARSLNNLGGLLEDMGEYGQALPYHERALAMSEALYPKDRYPQGHPELAITLGSLGALLRSMGEYGQALSYLERALAMRETLYPKDKYPQGHPELAISLSNVGGLWEYSGEYGKARSYYEQALAMSEALYPTNKYPHGHPYVVSSLNNLGVLLMKSMGEDGQALSYLERALALREALYPKDKYPLGHPQLALSLNNLGALLRSLGSYVKALPYHERALAMSEALYPKDKYPLGHPHVMASLNHVGGLLDLMGEPGKALSYWERALAMRAGLNEAFLAAASEAQALNYLAKLPLTRDGYLSVALRIPDTDAAAYAHVWHSKGALARLLERRRQAVLLSDPDVHQLAADLADTRSALAAQLLAPAGRFTDQEQRLKDLNQHKEKLERAIAEKLPAFAALQARARRTPRDLTDHLPPNTVFLDLLRYVRFEQDPKTPGKKGEKRTTCYAAFMLRPGQPVRRVELGEAAPIDQALREWRQAVLGWKKGRPEDRTRARALRERLWEPLAKQVPADTQVVFVAPDGPLTALPWAALPGRQPGTVLLEEHAVAVVPHGRLLLDQLLAGPGADAPGGRLLAVGAVQYDQEPAAGEPPQTLLALDRGAAVGEQALRWQPLPGTAAELEQVTALAGQRAVVPRRGVEAGTAQLVADLPKARWAHLATHGFFADAQFRSAFQVDEKLFERLLRASGEVFERSTFGARNPLVLSGLVLAGANRDQKDRGILTAEAIAGLPLAQLELAVLSACETGLGEVGGGEGVFGLQRAFHVAGCRTVVASLWKVDDEATAALMGLFYSKLWRERKPPLQALREAQLEVYRHPERIPAYARLRGPDLSREIPRPVETPEAAKSGARAATRLWAGFTLSGLGR
jgi:CHAT domain-containing protein/Tfp pilus assembly protein PilF